MANISSVPKVAYIYDAQSDTWHPTAGFANTSEDYVWSGDHTFEQTVTFENAVTFETVFNAQGGVNNFQNPAARDAAITSPTNGIVAFVRQDNSGNVLNQIQYYYNGFWVNHTLVTIEEKATSYTIQLSDLDRLIKVNSSSNLEVIIPPESSVNFPVGSRLEVFRAGTGEVSIVAQSGSGVTIRSKFNDARISAQYSGAMLTKVGADEWHLIGDLKA